MATQSLDQSDAAAPTANSGFGNDGQFHVSNGRIIDPSGNSFVAKGINVQSDQVDPATLFSTFPGLNAVRVPTTPGADLGPIDNMVNQLTSKGVVVMLEDHTSSGGNPNTLEGQPLADEAKWYADIASRYQSNPFVWFGTANEPDNTANMSAINTQESAIYDAIRGTGSQAMIVLETRGGFTADAALKDPGLFGQMTNTAWDVHYYGWVSNFSQDTGTIASALQKEISDAQSVYSKDGLMPVVVGEYGPSTTGSGPYDSNGLQVVDAANHSGKGTFAWAWNAGSDTLVNNGNLTDFGQMVAQHIAG